MLRNLLKVRNTLQYKPTYSFQNLKALFSDPIDDVCYEEFTGAGWEVERLPKTIPEEELKKIVGDYQALIVRSGTQVTEGIIDAGSNLKYIGRAGTGVDNINIPYATSKGILVMNTPGCNTVSAAEHTVSMMLALSRQIPQAQLTLQEGKWQRSKFVGSEVQNKTVGIVGFGAIGQFVAKQCSGFNMKIIAYDPVLAKDKYEDYGAEFATIEQILQQADYITLHTPLTKDTKNLINKETIAMMKPTARIINCARGGIINEEDLLEALENGKIGGAAIDVFSQEPPQELQLKLINHPKVVATPHLGASTEEAQVRVSARIAQQIVTAENGGALAGVVNAPKGFELAEKAQYKPYVNLGKSLGKLIQPITSRDYQIQTLEITYYGPLLEKAHSIITSSIQLGYLNSFRGADEQLNLLNINAVAKETGIQIVEKFVRKEHPYTNNAIQVKTVGDLNGLEVTKTILGSNFGPQRTPHVIGIDEYSIHLPLENVILMYRNENKPGNLSQVTKILSENEVNVENLHSGRDADKKQALTCVQVKEPLSKEVLNKLSAVKTIYDVQQISLFYKNGKKFSTVQKPAQKPNQPFFSSGPCKKHPEFDLVELSKKDSMKLLGRSHRSKDAKKRIVYSLEKTKELLGLPEDYEIAFMAGSDTGAFEAAMWNLLGSRPVDSLYWESFGKDWFNDIANELKIQVTNIGTSDYGKLPDLTQINKQHDLVFAFNGTTSGVKVENLDFISEDHEGLVFADSTSAIFSQDMTPYNKLDVITYSFQKALGGEAGMGVLILSPKAIKRLEEHTPTWPVPKLFRLKNKGKVNMSLFKDSPINTISMLTLEDYIDALEYVERIGGIKKCQELTNQNYQAVEKFVNQNTDWISFLCEEPSVRSNTSVCLKLNCSEKQIKEICAKLESENIAYDIGGYKAAPPSIRIWCGFTVQSQDIESCLDWLKYYYFEITKQ